jgi:hypothetical protein
VQRKIDTLREQQRAELVAMQQEQINCSSRSDPWAITRRFELRFVQNGP